MYWVFRNDTVKCNALPDASSLFTLRTIYQECFIIQVFDLFMYVFFTDLMQLNNVHIRGRLEVINSMLSKWGVERMFTVPSMPQCEWSCTEFSTSSFTVNVYYRHQPQIENLYLNRILNLHLVPFLVSDLGYCCLSLQLIALSSTWSCLFDSLMANMLCTAYCNSSY